VRYWDGDANAGLDHGEVGGRDLLSNSSIKQKRCNSFVSAPTAITMVVEDLLASAPEGRPSPLRARSLIQRDSSSPLGRYSPSTTCRPAPACTRRARSGSKARE